MSENQENSTAEKKPLDTKIMIVEYDALRNEILKRMEIGNQLTTFTIIVFGTILGIGYQNKFTSLILLYPLIALFLTITLVHNEYHIRQIALYIKDHVESAVGTINIGWETFLTTNRYSRQSLGVGGIILATELLAIVVGMSIVPFNSTFLVVLIGQPMENPSFTINLLLGIAIVSFLITPFMLRQSPVKPIVSKFTKG